MPVTTAFAVSTSPALPPGLTKDVPMSTDTPVMYWPLVATASEPRVSVRDMIRPPWTVCGKREYWHETNHNKIIALTPTRLT